MFEKLSVVGDLSQQRFSTVIKCIPGSSRFFLECIRCFLFKISYIVEHTHFSCLLFAEEVVQTCFFLENDYYFLKITDTTPSAASSQLFGYNWVKLTLEKYKTPTNLTEFEYSPNIKISGKNVIFHFICMTPTYLKEQRFSAFVEIKK